MQYGKAGNPANPYKPYSYTPGHSCEDCMLTFVHDFGKVSVLGRVLEGDEVHAPLSAEVPGVEPIPVLRNAVFLSRAGVGGARNHNKDTGADLDPIAPNQTSRFVVINMHT